jgi:hypothetical protein
MSNIYLIPVKLHCPICWYDLGSAFTILECPIVCPSCKEVLQSNDFGKQFGMIKGVNDVQKTTQSTKNQGN